MKSKQKNPKLYANKDFGLNQNSPRVSTNNNILENILHSLGLSNSLIITFNIQK